MRTRWRIPEPLSPEAAARLRGRLSGELIAVGLDEA